MSHVADAGCEVDVFGMVVEHGSLIHADKHGAVVIPLEVAPLLPAAVDTILLREGVILEAIRGSWFSISRLSKRPSATPRRSTRRGVGGTS